MVVGKPKKTKRYERWRIRPPTQFKKTSLRTHDIGRKGFSKRIAGRLKTTGKWQTQAILIDHKESPSMKKRLRTSAKAQTRRAKGVKRKRRK